MKISRTKTCDRYTFLCWSDFIYIFLNNSLIFKPFIDFFIKVNTFQFGEEQRNVLYQMKHIISSGSVLLITLIGKQNVIVVFVLVVKAQVFF